MKVLLTGATGILGRSFNKLYQKEYQILPLSLRGREGTQTCDLANSSEVERVCDKFFPDVIIHTAALSNVDICENSPILAYQNNALSTKNLASWCAHKSKRLIHISTDYVFGGREQIFYRENDPVFPVNVYGLSKLIAERWIAQLPLDATILRISWLFGQGNPDNFVEVIKGRLQRKESFAVLNDQIACPTFADDVSKAIDMIINQKKSKETEIYHFCNQKTATRLEMALEMKKILNANTCEITHAQKTQIAGRVALRPARSVMNTDLFNSCYFQPTDWMNALKRYLLS